MTKVYEKISETEVKIRDLGVLDHIETVASIETALVSIQTELDELQGRLTSKQTELNKDKTEVQAALGV